MVTKLLVFSALLSLAFAKSTARSTKVHEAISAPPPGYVSNGPAPADTELNLRIALAHSDPDGLIDALYAVSSPDGPSYGQHLSKEEVEQFVTPTAQTSDAVKTWLAQAGVNATPISSAGDWLAITVPVSLANELFNADFNHFTHSETGNKITRTLQYSVPTGLKEHIDLMHPSVTFSNLIHIRPAFSTRSGLERRATEEMKSCSTDGITPACIEFLYGIPTARATQSSNYLAVSGFNEQFANKVDLATFLDKFQPDLSGMTFTLQTIDGGSNSQNGSEAGIEANLDIQYATSISQGAPVTFISVGEDNHDGFELGGFLDIILFLLGESNPPQVLTTSYGENENEISPLLAAKLCNAYAQLGARGASIIFASGDGGVSGAQSHNCSKFVPTFPSGCPFMTSVGATQLTSSSGGETAASFSAGGFSNDFVTPSYQAHAVESYLSSIGSTNSGKFNTSGRGYPDVAAIGVNVTIVVNGTSGTVAGTSCASPIFAGMITLINDALIAANKSTLGFLNPFLYANPDAFNDITTGSNPGCNASGFPALEGWDPVTGLGSPNFVALKAAALKAAGVSYTYPVQMADIMQDVLSL
ncbi:uncharacterized protein PHACADRAFT_207476 [Phanerochaete carnosa HHB-10118-sp]|uniref:tripeptidyl-peptidase II n=1 Tax=Phanerochaete carnosa (strain HHB-10118-sp) TaxID=650164 RepID=K5WHU1_PHACS|nr:uncharacterized protein PHACADRAFT_207476 [Phanerochaete carnosa HHB-10118-sp]EKM58689.1 hypothetical protein PHACADRAFT_207476 [Phanerochaete carnosa HHB-10118-sp]